MDIGGIEGDWGVIEVDSEESGPVNDFEQAVLL